MATKRKSFFIDRPRTFTDLIAHYNNEDESTYSVKTRIDLNAIDYENFITDMLVSRDYIEESAHLFTDGNNELDCLFISQNDSSEGILVVPGKNGLIRLAAFLEE